MAPQETAREHLRNAIQLVQNMMVDTAGAEEDLGVRKEKVNDLTAIRNRIEAALLLVDEVVEVDTTYTAYISDLRRSAQLRAYRVLEKVRKVL